MSALNENSVFITMQDDSLIPSFYSDEPTAFQSNSPDLNEISLERFSDQGYSLVCFSGYVTEDRYLRFTKDGLVANSSFQKAIGETDSNDKCIYNYKEEFLNIK